MIDGSPRTWGPPRRSGSWTRRGAPLDKACGAVSVVIGVTRAATDDTNWPTTSVAKAVNAIAVVPALVITSRTRFRRKLIWKSTYSAANPTNSRPASSSTSTRVRRARPTAAGTGLPAVMSRRSVPGTAICRREQLRARHHEVTARSTWKSTCWRRRSAGSTATVAVAVAAPRSERPGATAAGSAGTGVFACVHRSQRRGRPTETPRDPVVRRERMQASMPTPR